MPRRYYRPNGRISPKVADALTRLPCRNPHYNPDDWFSDDPAIQAAAAERCQLACPAAAQSACLTIGMESRNRSFGVWGGVTAEQRVRLGKIAARRRSQAKKKAKKKAEATQ